MRSRSEPGLGLGGVESDMNANRYVLQLLVVDSSLVAAVVGRDYLFVGISRSRSADQHARPLRNTLRRMCDFIFLLRCPFEAPLKQPNLSTGFDGKAQKITKKET